MDAAVGSKDRVHATTLKTKIKYMMRRTVS